MGTQQRAAWSGRTASAQPAPGWEPIRALVHDALAVSAEGECIPRVVIRCQTCGRDVLYCHVRDSAIRASVERSYVCADCGGAS